MIWSYGDSEVHEVWNNIFLDYNGAIVTHDFFRELIDHPVTVEDLDIQTVEFTKYRFLLLSERYVVPNKKILHTDQLPWTDR